jgi:chemotaxis signal transduction protein
MPAYLCVEIGGRRLALNAEHVTEVVGTRLWVPYHEGRAGLIGAMAWQGGAIALIDVGAMTGLAPALTPSERRPRTSIVRASGLTAALPVHVVREAVEVPDTAVEAGTPAPFCSQTVVLDGDKLPVFDVPAALEACRPGGGP